MMCIYALKNEMLNIFYFYKLYEYMCVWHTLSKISGSVPD